MKPSPSRSHRSAPDHPSFSWVSLLDWGMEFIIALILMISPWLFGGVQPYHVHLACLGIGIVLVLWSLKQLLTWKLTLYRCMVSMLLVVLFLITCMSLIALPRSALSWLGPEVKRKYEQLLPSTQEVPMMDTKEEQLPFSPGTTLSLYPGATQTRLVELLAAMVLFVVVRHGLATPERFARWAILMVANGCILSVFALIQKVRSPGYMIYGFEVPGECFGPFINRNHFPSYVNFSICLGLGLFLAVMQRKPGSYSSTDTTQKMKVSYTTGAWSELLQHPLAVWLLIPIAVCMTAVLASLSRGGILAMFAGLAIAILLWRRKGQTQSLIAISTIPVLALGLLLWYGATPTLQRLEQEQVIPEGRFAIWQASWSAFCHYPLLGTGLGTFSYVEPIYRPAGINQSIIHEHAHNEYMEALVEGGLVRFVITLGLVWLVLRRGWQALGNRQRSNNQALALGGLAACITLAIQSIGEFGVQISSVAGVLAVTAGYLVALGGPRRAESEVDPALIRWNYFGVGPILGTVFALTLGVILFAGTWLNWQSEHYRLTGLKTRQSALNDPVSLKKAVDLLDAAIFYSPAHARLRMERYEIEHQRLVAIEVRERLEFQETLRLQQWLRSTSSLTTFPTHSLHGTLYAVEETMLPIMAQMAMSEHLVKQQIDSWKQQQAHLRASRNLCPLAWRPHLDVGEHVVPARAVLSAKDRLLYWKQSEPLAKYLDRIKLLHPHRAETWFVCGHQEALNGQREQALQSWRRSLEISEEFLEPIIQESTMAVLMPEMKLSTSEIMERLIPGDSASHFVKAAWVLFPKTNQVEDRKPYMEKAIRILEKRQDVLSPENQFTYGLALWGANQPEQAIQYILVATRGRPDRPLWRIDLARLYLELEKFAEAREQLGIVQTALPGNPEVIEMLQKLDALQRPPRQ